MKEIVCISIMYYTHNVRFAMSRKARVMIQKMGEEEEEHFYEKNKKHKKPKSWGHEIISERLS